MTVELILIAAEKAIERKWNEKAGIAVWDMK